MLLLLLLLFLLKHFLLVLRPLIEDAINISNEFRLTCKMFIYSGGGNSHATQKAVALRRSQLLAATRFLAAILQTEYCKQTKIRRKNWLKKTSLKIDVD